LTAQRRFIILLTERHDLSASAGATAAVLSPLAA
jgi:hypothetical protein